MFDKKRPKEHLAARCMAQNQPLSYLLLFPAPWRRESRKMEGRRYKGLHKGCIYRDPLEWRKGTHSCALPTSLSSSPRPHAVIWNCSSITCVSLRVIQSPSFIGWRYPFHFICPGLSFVLCSCGRLLLILQQPDHRPSLPRIG